MRKVFLSFFVIVFSLTQLIAQENTFKTGDKVVSLGVGLGSTYYAGFYSSRSPALAAGFEVAVVDNVLDKGSIGVGGYLGYSSAKYSTYWKTSNILIGGRGSFHYPLVDKLDTYTGLLLGYNIFSTEYVTHYTGFNSASTNSLAFAWFAGARYYFTDNFAGMAEIGYGIAVLTIGASIKF
jgi:opacity protein-like surface antigen